MSTSGFMGASVLLPELFKPCHRLERDAGSGDGMFGRNDKWVEGAALPVLMKKDRSPEAQVAEQSGQRAVYTVCVEKGTVLRRGDVIRRDADGLILRLTGDTIDGEAPDMSTVQLARAAAERWDPPT